MTVIDFMKKKKEIILKEDNHFKSRIINPRLELLNTLPRIREVFGEETKEEALYYSMSDIFDRYSICLNHFNRFSLIKYLLAKNKRHTYKHYTCMSGNFLSGSTFVAFDIYKKQKVAYLEELNVLSQEKIEIKIIAYYRNFEKILDEYNIKIKDLDCLSDFEIIELLKSAKNKYSKIPSKLKERRVVTMNQIRKDCKNIYNHIVDVDLDLINFIPNINQSEEYNYDREDLLIYNRLVNILRKYSIFKKEITKFHGSKHGYEMNNTGEVKDIKLAMNMYEYGEHSYLEGNTLTCFYPPNEEQRIFVEELEVVSKDEIKIKRIVDFGKIKKNIFKNKSIEKRFNRMSIKSKIDFLKREGKKYESKISKYPKCKTLLIKDNKIIEIKSKPYIQKDNLLILD